jgi:hypothetical protein
MIAQADNACLMLPSAMIAVPGGSVFDNTFETSAGSIEAGTSVKAALACA